MCLIVDANLCSVVFKSTTNRSYASLRKTIFSNRLTIVYGGKLIEEYRKAGVLSVIAALSQSGRAFKVKDALIDTQLAEIENSCTSDDAHIVALARADRRRARVLCTDDIALRNDFKNKSLIDNPRGTIYSSTRHKKSLSNC